MAAVVDFVRLSRAGSSIQIDYKIIIFLVLVNPNLLRVLNGFITINNIMQLVLVRFEFYDIDNYVNCFIIRTPQYLPHKLQSLLIQVCDYIR